VSIDYNPRRESEEFVHRLNEPDDGGPLPEVLEATLEFVRRLPSQRMLDALAKLEPEPFGDLQSNQPSRVLAFRTLVRNYPNRDLASLWMHAYECEVQLVDADPTSGSELLQSLLSAPTTE
jgi:hypothetical protein